MVRRLARNPILWLLAAALMAVGLYLALAVFGVQTLFYSNEVNEDFPVAAEGASAGSAPRGSDPAATTTPETSPAPETANQEVNPAQPATSDAEAEPAPAEAEPAPAEAEPVPAEPAGPVLVSSGQFHAVSHPGTGDVLVYQLEDGSYVLRLEDIDIFNGPALYVYAVAAPDANDANTVLDAGFVDAGPLKGNQGSQTYELPANFDPEVHRSVSVWCERFAVNFATAPLT